MAAISILVSSQFALATPTAAAPNASSPQGPSVDGEATCKFLVSIGDLSANQLGACIATGTTGDRYFIDGRSDFRGFVAAACNYFRDVAPDYFYSQWDSIPECLADNAGY